MTPSPAATPRRQMRALCLAAGLAFASTLTGFAQVPADLQRNFSTTRGSVKMMWSPGGYWYSAPGALRGSDSDVSGFLSIMNSSELAGRKLPPGFAFRKGSQRELVLSSNAIGVPALPVAPIKASKSKFEDLPSRVPGPSPVAATPAPYVPRPAVKGKPVQIPPMTQEKPKVAPTSVPKAVPYVAKPKPVDDTPPPAVKPKPTSGPKLIADEPPATPVALPAPKPAIPDAPTTPGGMINGIPPAMQKSFLSRNKSVFMIFDKDKGQWSSSPGAVKDLEAADEWCKQATTVDRSYGRIPEGFSYHHMGSGQVQIRKD